MKDLKKFLLEHKIYHTTLEPYTDITASYIASLLNGHREGKSAQDKVWQATWDYIQDLVNGANKLFSEE